MRYEVNSGKNYKFRSKKAFQDWTIRSKYSERSNKVC